MFKIFVPETRNAVDFYIHIVEKAAQKAGEEVKWIKSASEINRDDIVFAIDHNNGFKAMLRRPRKLVHWYQGVAPEERTLYDTRNRLYVKLVYYAHSWLESLMLNNADLHLFVSKTMKNHYEKKHHLNPIKNYVIMPCFNTEMDENSFYDEKYRKPTFLYSGNTAGWQCFPQIVALFKRIKETMIPEAELKIYSGDKEKVKEELDKQGVKAEIRFVHYTKLNEEIKQFKYGFLIREDNVVNNVATPTKMSSYLGNGIIPIFSNVIGDFKEIFENVHYSVPLGANYEGLDKLVELDKQYISGDEVKKDYKQIFDQYYNEDYYINLISEKIIALKK